MAKSSEHGAKSEKQARNRDKRSRLTTALESRPPSFDKRIKTARRILTLSLLAATGVLVALCFAPIEEYYSAPGRVLPGDYRELYAPADAIVAETLADDGDHVTTGQILMRFTLRDYERQILDTTIQLDTLKAQLNLQEKRNAATEMMPLPKDLWGIQESIAKTEADMRYHTSHLARLKELVDVGAASAQQIEQVELQLETATIENKRQTERFKVLEEGYRESLVAQSEAEVELYRQRIKGAEKSLAFLKSERDRLSVLRSPCDGVVLDMHNDDLGEAVKRGALLVYMTEGDSRIVRLDGGQRNIHMVRIGQTVRYKSDIYDPLDFEYAEGKVVYVAAIRDEAWVARNPGGDLPETYTIYATIDIEPQELLLDSTVQAEVVLRKDRLARILFGFDKLEKRPEQPATE